MTDAAKKPAGFVSLTSLKQGPPDPKAALAELRHIYFNTTRKTIQHDFDHAIDLLKTLPTEEDREKATVYMEGIAQMRKDWTPRERKQAPTRKQRRP